MDVNIFLQQAFNYGASDVHLAQGFLPIIRVSGRLQPLSENKLTGEDMEAILNQVASTEAVERFKQKKELDFSYSAPGISRFRGNAMIQRGSVSIVMRLIPHRIPQIDELGLPPIVKELCWLNRGLVLVTGPTGSGKSTTLASMIDLINKERDLNVVTIEDPIEYLHSNDKSIIKQREVGEDTDSFADALRHVLRHDPDVILVGEMRDLESIAIALTAAETGHLVFSTLHTQTAPLTVNRIIDVFSSEIRQQVRHQLSNSVRGVVSQQLCPKKNGDGRVVATEIMLGSTAVRNLIREGKEHQLYGTMQNSPGSGMRTMDQSLVQLYKDDKITSKALQERAVDLEEIKTVFEQIARKPNR